MTSETIIMTKEGITLASDLAITTPSNKSYNCANKIFKITDDFPIGIMINGNVDFEEIPLETLIGEFSKTIDFKNLKSIETVKNKFIDYLSVNTNHTSLDEYISWILESFKDDILRDIEENGFEEILNYYHHDELSPLIKNYNNFDREFFDIIPDNSIKRRVI